MEKGIPVAEGRTISERLIFWGETEPSAPAFIFWGAKGRFVLSRGDVLDLSSRFAYRLSQHGVKPGDVVCVTLPNSPERVVVDFGVQLAGAIPMNGQALSTDGKDLVESMRAVQCKMLVADPDITAGAWNICKQHFDLKNIQDNFGEIACEKVPTLTVVEFCRTQKPNIQFLTSLQTEGKLALHTQKPSDTAYIFATSGSSGFTKMVPHTHKSLLRSAGKNKDDGIETKKMDKFCCCAPLGWLGGFPLTFLHNGCSIVLFDDSAGNIPDRLQMLWKMISSEKVHMAVLMPVMYMAIFRMKDVWNPSGFRLKTLTSTGQPIKRENLDVIGHLTDSILCMYACTETGQISGMTIHGNNISSFHNSTAGFPFDDVGIRIVDADLEDVETGSRGEILVHSDTLCKEYMGQKSTSFLPDGWFRTDDVGYMNSSGHLIVEGRSSDAIMHGAYILYPYWLEEKLTRCPGVKQIVIVPVPDPDLHHEICACVQPEEGADFTAKKIIDFCKNEMEVDIQSSMKFIPKYVVNFDMFPLTKTFKLNRKEIASIARKDLNL